MTDVVAGEKNAHEITSQPPILSSDPLLLVLQSHAILSTNPYFN